MNENDEKTISDLNSSLSENKKLSDEFKMLAITSLGRIFTMLGRENFIRWINQSHLSERLQQLVIETMTEEEIEKHPYWSGFYTVGTNVIKILNGENNNQKDDIATHEGVHFVVDKPSIFGTFLDEGLTEYLKGLAGDGPNCYEENVATVKFLHKMLGDIIIKAYLTGNTEEFDDKFKNIVYTNEELQLLYFQRAIPNFYSALEKYHEYVCSKDFYLAKQKKGTCTEEELQNYEDRYKQNEKRYLEVRLDVLKMFQRIIVRRITQMAKNFDFYKDGRLDLELANKTIKEMIDLAPFSTFAREFKLTEEMKHQTLELAFQSIIENTHLLAYKNGEERETQKQRLLSKLVPVVTITDNEVQKADITINNNDPEFASKNENVTIDLLHMLEKETNLSLQQYLERLAILQERMNISDEEMEHILAQHNNDRFKNMNSGRKVSMAIIKAFPRLRKINQLYEEKERNTVTSTYRSIGEDCYVEQRDNQFFYIEIDENGEIKEQLLPYIQNVVFSGLYRRIDISCEDSITDIQVQKNGIDITPGNQISAEKMKEVEFDRALTANIKEKLKKQDYVITLDDAPNPYAIKDVAYTYDVDERSRKIDFKQFISDMIDIRCFIDGYRKETILESLTTELLDRVYGTTIERKNNTNIRRVHTSIVSLISTFVRRENYNPSDRDIEELDKAISVLDECRKSRVKQNKSKALVVFLTPEAQDEYMKSADKVCIDENVQHFSYRDFYRIEGEIPVEHIPFPTSGVEKTKPIDSRPVTFNYNDFCQEIKRIVSSVQPRISGEIFDRIINMQMQTMFFRIPTDFNENPDIKNAADYVINAIRENVFDDKEINNDEMAKKIDILNDYRVSSIKGAKFTDVDRNSNSEQRFFTLDELIKYLNVAGVSPTQIMGLVENLTEATRNAQNENTLYTKSADEGPDFE